jgi:hypothetical protein
MRLAVIIADHDADPAVERQLAIVYARRFHGIVMRLGRIQIRGLSDGPLKAASSIGCRFFLTNVAVSHGHIERTQARIRSARVDTGT